MQFSTTALAALAAVTQLSGVAHAYTWDDNLGRPICEDVDGQGAVDFSNLDCGSSVAKLEACNNMCASQSRGCTWGSKSQSCGLYIFTHLDSSLLYQSSLYPLAMCLSCQCWLRWYENSCIFLRARMLTRFKKDPELDFTCGQTASYIHACNQCHFTF